MPQIFDLYIKKLHIKKSFKNIKTLSLYHIRYSVIAYTAKYMMCLSDLHNDVYHIFASHSIKIYLLIILRLPTRKIPANKIMIMDSAGRLINATLHFNLLFRRYSRAQLLYSFISIVLLLIHNCSCFIILQNAALSYLCQFDSRIILKLCFTKLEQMFHFQIISFNNQKHR